MPVYDASANDPATPVRPVSPIAPVPAVGSAASQASLQQDSSTDNGGQQNGQAASAAEYARANAQIASIFADLNATSATPPSLSQAQDRVVALLPAPIVIIPLPPANADMVQRAVEVAQEMVEKAALTRAAQAHVNVGTVDQILSAVA